MWEDSALADGRELSTVHSYTTRKRLSLVPTQIFELNAHRALFSATCPPRKKDLGTNLREVKAVPTLPHVFANLTSTARGLPIVSEKEQIDRCSMPGLPSQKEGQPLLPTKETPARRRAAARWWA